MVAANTACIVRSASARNNGTFNSAVWSRKDSLHLNTIMYRHTTGNLLNIVHACMCQAGLANGKGDITMALYATDPQVLDSILERLERSQHQAVLKIQCRSNPNGKNAVSTFPDPS